MKTTTFQSFAVAALVAISAGNALAQGPAATQLQNQSVTPALIDVNKDIPNVRAFSIIGSDDDIAASPNYTFGGSADGAGFVRNSDGTFTFLVNHEDHYGVSRLVFDRNLKATSGEWVLNSNAGRWRLCSATMANLKEHGFYRFITCGESSAESMTHGFNPKMVGTLTTEAAAYPTYATGLGRWNAENAVPLPYAAFSNGFQNQTVVILGDDDSGTDGGQVALYIGNRGDLKNGNLYALRRTDLNQRELDNAVGATHNVEFVQIPNQNTLTGAQINAYSNNVINSIRFGRVEDLDYGKGGAAGDGTDVWFTVTGQSGSADRTKWGRIYHLSLNPANPLVGTLTCVLGGDDKSLTNPAREFMNPDNICVTKDYVYIQEDANTYSGGNPASADYIYENHDARIYQWDVTNSAFAILAELDHHRNKADSAYYQRNVTFSGNVEATNTYRRSINGSWEYGAMIDAEQMTGIPNSFVVSVQPHSWRYAAYQNIDGGTVRPRENQASQLVLLTGVPRSIETPVTVAASPIRAFDCARMNLSKVNDRVIATKVAGADGYEWEVLDGSNVIYTAVTSNAGLSVDAISALQYSTTYTFRVRAFDGLSFGPWSNCNISTIAQTAPAATQLVANQCGATVNIHIGNLDAVKVENADSYTFKAYSDAAATMMVETKTSAKRSVPASVLSLACNATYYVTVTANVDGMMSAAGDTCMIITDCTAAPRLAGASVAQTIAIYPNPAVNEATINLGNTAEATIVVADLAGRTLINRTVAGGTTTFGAELAAGIYTVTVTQGQNVYTEEFIKQ